jgi:hypothetical protein
MRGKLNELWAVVGALLNGARGGREGIGGTEWAVVDEEGLAQIAQVCCVHILFPSIADDGYLDSGGAASRSTTSNENITARLEGLGSDSERGTRWGGDYLVTSRWPPVLV